MKNAAFGGHNLIDPTSTNLLRQVVRGDQEAWERFVGIYSALIYERCRRRGVTAEDAADLVQEVLRRVHQAIGGLQRGGPDQGLRRWLKTIAKNVITDHFRKIAVERHGLGQDIVEGLLRELQAPTDSSSDGFLPEFAGIAALRIVLETAQLDYEISTWRAFWQTVVEEQPAVVVAKDLGVSPGTVRQARYKILKRLRNDLSHLAEFL